MMKEATLLAVLTVLAAAAPGAAAVKIELQQEAVVSGSVARLGDVALVEAGEATAALRELIVCPAPVVGRSVELASARVKARLSALLGAEPFELTGAVRCLIRREARPPADGADAGTAGAGENAGTLENRLRQFVLARLSRPDAEARIEFNPRDRELLALGENRYLFKIHCASSEFDAGPVTVRVDVSERASPAQVVQSPHVRLSLVVIDDIVVAARDIRRGDVLAQSDLRLERREMRDPPRGLPLRDLADAVGATARSSIAAGQLVRCEDLTKTLLVRRGDAVTVYMRGSGFTVRTVCRALEAGEQGATVAVQGQDGSGKFYATVIGPKTVELRSHAAAPENPASRARPQPHRPDGAGDERPAAMPERATTTAASERSPT